MLESDLQTIATQWQPLFALCDDAGAFRLAADDVSAWSIAQHLGHLGIINNLLADSIENLLANPDTDAGAEPNELGAAVLKAGEIPRGRGKAPEMLIYQGEPEAGGIRGMLEQAKEKWETFPSRSQQLLDCPATFPHFALGSFTPAQWVRFNNLHTEHHLKIIRDIAKATGQTLSI